MVSATRRIIIEVLGKDSTKGFRSLKQSLGEIKNLIGSLEQAMQPNINFEAEMSRVKAITRTVGEEFKALERLAKTMGSTTFFSGTQAAEGIRFLGMAGVQTDDIFKVLPSTLNLARVGMMDLGRAADITTNIMSGMGLPLAEAKRLIDVMAAAVTSANIDIEELGRGMRVAAPWARAYGVEMEELVTVLMAMNDAGIKGADAGQKIKMWMQFMIGPTENMKKSVDLASLAMVRSGQAAEGFNLNFKELDGTLRNLLIISDELSKADIMPSGWTDMFGKKGGTAPVALAMDETVEKMRKWHEVLVQSADASENMADIIDDNLKGSIVELGSAWEGLAISLGEIVNPMIRATLELLTNLIRATTSLVEAMKGEGGSGIASAGFVPSFGGSGSATAQERIGSFMKDRKARGFGEGLSLFWENQKKGWSEGADWFRGGEGAGAGAGVQANLFTKSQPFPQVTSKPFKFSPARPGVPIGFGGGGAEDEAAGMGSFRQYQEMQRRQQERAKMMQFAPGALDLEGMEPPDDFVRPWREAIPEALRSREFKQDLGLSLQGLTKGDLTMRAAVANVGSSLGHLVGDKMAPELGTALQTGLQTIAAGGGFKAALANIGFATGIDVGTRVAAATSNPILGAIAGLGTFVASYVLGRDDKKSERDRVSKMRENEAAYEKAKKSGRVDLFSVGESRRQQIRGISDFGDQDRESRLGFLKQEDFSSNEWRSILAIIRNEGAATSGFERRTSRTRSGPGEEDLPTETKRSLRTRTDAPTRTRRDESQEVSGKIIEGFDRFVDQTYNDLLTWEPQAPAATTTTRPALDPVLQEDANTPAVHVTVNVQALDASGVEGIVNRVIVPLVKRALRDASYRRAPLVSDTGVYNEAAYLDLLDAES